MCKEIGVSEGVLERIGAMGFQNLRATRDSADFEQKICEYADLRVGPFGVLSLADRIADIHKRYHGRGQESVTNDAQEFKELSHAAEEVERQIFEMTSLKPEAISDDSIALIMAELPLMEIA